MMNKRNIILLLLVLAIGYAVGFSFDIFLFLPIAILTLYFLIFFVLLLTAINIVLMLFPRGIREHYKNNSKKFKAIILFCSVFLFFMLWAINHFCFPHKLHPISLIGDAGILLFTIFLGWCFAGIRKRKIAIIIGITIFALFIFFTSHSGTKTYQHSPPSSLEALKSLPYLSWVPTEDKDEDKKGVTIQNQDLFYEGINLYADVDDTKAYLMDMSGEILHTWSSGLNKWHYVEMYDNGDLLGMIEDQKIIKLDWGSNIIWERNRRFHHDVAITESQNIYTFTRRDRILLHKGLPLPVLDDYIVLISDDGRVKKSISVYELFKEKIECSTVAKIYKWFLKPHMLVELLITKKSKNFAFEGWFRCAADIFHSNSLEIINKDIKGVCKKGDLLICVRNFDLIAILDVDKEKLVWEWGPGQVRMPHHPTMLENGNILIFDNGWEREYTRIVELDPRTKRIVWEYKADPPEEFFSLKRGANQRLPNGNTLITESDKGRVFEVTKDGKIVWEFYIPEIDEETKTRRAIYRMLRITEPEKYPYLNKVDY